MWKKCKAVKCVVCIDSKMSECPICCEAFNKKMNKEFQCGYCDYMCCIACVKQYLVTLVGRPKCMNCNTAWLNRFLVEKFPASWWNKDFKTNREDFLYSIEQSKIPDTQKFVQYAINIDTLNAELCIAKKKLVELKKREKIERKAFDELARTVHEKKKEKQPFQTDLETLYRLDTLLQQELADQISAVKAQITDTSTEIKRQQTMLTSAEGEQEDEVDKAKQDESRVVMQCPINSCKGFICSGWKCGLCQTAVCKKCREIESRDHVCDPDVVRSVEVIQSDSKACPKCSALIFKVSGCDQMWCTRCQTTFSWNRGNIEDGLIHNPHFLEWLRAQPQPLENPREEEPRCGDRYVTNNLFRIKIAVDEVVSSESRDTVWNLVRLLVHIVEEEISRLEPTYKRQIPSDPNRDIRISFMRNLLSEKDFKALLLKREKEELKNVELGEAYAMFVDVMDDLLFALLSRRSLQLSKFLSNVDEMRLYFNNAIEKTFKDLKLPMKRVPVIDKDLKHFVQPNAPADS